MTQKQPPTPDTLRKLLRYDPDTGLLFWRERDISFFKNGYGRYTADRNQKIWNSKLAGKEAFITVMNGYRQGSIFGVRYLAHRVAWAIHYGKWPEKTLDHINHDPSANRIVNLREISHRKNCKNMSLSAANSSGFTGVYWRKDADKWVARINPDGRRIHLGLFQNKLDAVAARKSADLKYGFHENHGKE